MTVPVSVIDQVANALSVSSLQHRVTVSNIANRDTQGYQRMQLRFDRAMNEPGAAEVISESAEAPASLEQDLSALSSNAIQYEALTRVLNRYFSVLAVISNYNRG
jgi:flagellar basal body rod protein FlgB